VKHCAAFIFVIASGIRNGRYSVSTKMSLLAIDLGSSQCKAVVFKANGDALARSIRTYAPEFPQPSHCEMDPERFWLAATEAARAATRGSRHDPVHAICFSSHGETFIPADPSGAAIAPAILNIDARAASEAAWCEKTIGRKRLFSISGLVAHSMYPLPKILWLRQHRSDVFGRAACFLGVTDYILRRLGLPPYIDYSLAGRFLAFDISQHKWSDDLLGLADLKESQLPLPVPAGTVAGKLATDMAEVLGVAAGTPVVVGGHDQVCGALGAGVIEKGRVSDSMGTYECVVAASDAPSLGDEALAASLNSYSHVVPRKYATLAYFPSGIMVQWFRDLVFGSPRSIKNSHALPDESAVYDSLESRCPAGPSGLCITPHLIGTCNPDFDESARGVIFGLTPDSGRGQIYKGILEGVACELAHICEALEKAAGGFDDIYATGGGSQSRLGLKLRASLTGRRIHAMQSHESVCLGAAVLAGVATGTYATISEAVRQVVREKETIDPDTELAASYAAQMKKYQLLYAALAPVRHFRGAYSSSGGSRP
jgi:xylulokinase